MCLALLAWNVIPGHRLIVATNRDEFHWRKTEPLHRWPDSPIVAGRDTAGGGTWLGTTSTGKIGLVTNVRDGLPSRNKAATPHRSRGLLIRDYLESDTTPAAFISNVENSAEHYQPFNLIVGDHDTLSWITNWHGFRSIVLKPGVYGLSNAELDSAWPKVQSGKADVARLLNAESITAGTSEYTARLFGVLANRSQPSDEYLPHTRIPRQIERVLSPRFVHAGLYGTRASTIVDIPHNGAPTMHERRFGYRRKDQHGRRRSTASVRVTGKCPTGVLKTGTITLADNDAEHLSPAATSTRPPLSFGRSSKPRAAVARPGMTSCPCH